MAVFQLPHSRLLVGGSPVAHLFSKLDQSFVQAGGFCAQTVDSGCEREPSGHAGLGPGQGRMPGQPSLQRDCKLGGMLVPAPWIRVDDVSQPGRQGVERFFGVELSAGGSFQHVRGRASRHWATMDTLDEDCTQREHIPADTGRPPLACSGDM